MRVARVLAASCLTYAGAVLLGKLLPITQTVRPGRRKLPIDLSAKSEDGSARFYKIAHRGGKETTAENTVASFLNAVKQGMDVLELDVHLTQDGEVVVHHDRDYSRMCGLSKSVADVSSQNLPRIRHHPDRDPDCHPGPEPDTGLRLCLFASLLMLPLTHVL